MGLSPNIWCYSIHIWFKMYRKWCRHLLTITGTFFFLLAMHIKPSLMDLLPSKIEITALTHSATRWPPSAALLTIHNAVGSLQLKKLNYKRKNTLRIQNTLMKMGKKWKTLKLSCLFLYNASKFSDAMQIFMKEMACWFIIHLGFGGKADQCTFWYT